MDLQGGELQAQPNLKEQLPPFPRIWIGYLMGVATLITEIVAISLHPELAKEPLLVPPLYLFLANFVSMVYWLVCVHQYHVVLKAATDGAYAIKPLKAALYTLIPIYGFYWSFKWPRELAFFVNNRLQTPLMKPDRIGLAAITAFIAFLILDRGFGMILLFWTASYLSRCLRLSLAEKSDSPGGPHPFS
jgi:hypothetical protein